jgi:hypothetical protein
MRDRIRIRSGQLKENNQPLEPEQLKKEAERLQQRLSKKAAGRVCWQSREEWEAAYANIAAYYKEKAAWNKLFRS